MMTTRLKPVQLAIQSMRQHRHRMPVCRYGMGEDPPDAPARQPSLNRGVAGYVRVVIEINEVVMKCSAEDNPNQNRERCANADLKPVIFWSGTRLRHTF